MNECLHKISCPRKLSYNAKYDAYFCSVCDEWKSSKCDDKDCFYCPIRPEKPSEAKKEKNER